MVSVNILSQVREQSFKENLIKTINKITEHLIKNPTIELLNKTLDIDTTEIIVYSECPFAGNDDGSSQVGYLTFLAGKGLNETPSD